MSRQAIGIGAAANDGTGDPLRTAFTKTNENVSEIYSLLGGDTLTIAGARTALGIGTADSPTFAGVTLGALSSIKFTGLTANALLLSDGTDLTQSANLTFVSDQLRIVAGTAVAPSYTFVAAPAYGMYFNSASGVAFTHNGSDTFGTKTGQLAAVSSVVIGWSVGALSQGLDTALSRISAGLIGVGTGAAGSFAGSLKLSNLITTGAAASGGAGTVAFGGTTQTTIGANGGASALTALPLGYITVNVAGTAAIIPYYNA